MFCYKVEKLQKNCFDTENLGENFLLSVRNGSFVLGMLDWDGDG